MKITGGTIKRDELESIICNIALYTITGLAVAHGEGQKQFMLERIALELGMSLTDIRETFCAEPGEIFDISRLLK